MRFVALNVKMPWQMPLNTFIYHLQGQTGPKTERPQGFWCIRGSLGLQWIDESRPFGSGLLAYLVAEELGGENY